MLLPRRLVDNCYVVPHSCEARAVDSREAWHTSTTTESERFHRIPEFAFSNVEVAPATNVMRWSIFCWPRLR